MPKNRLPKPPPNSQAGTVPSSAITVDKKLYKMEGRALGEGGECFSDPPQNARACPIVELSYQWLKQIIPLTLTIRD